MTDKAAIQAKAQQLIAMTAGYCDRHLDDDYKQLCEKLILKMSRKRNVPFETGRMEIWAAAVVYAIGSINFLFDKSFKPYATADDISDYFDTSKSTVGQKAKLIRDMFKMIYFDKDFTTRRMSDGGYLNNLMMLNGHVIDLRQLLPIKSIRP